MRPDPSIISPVDRLRYLRCEPIFRELGLAELALVAESLQERRFHRGEPLLREDEASGASYVIVDGRVRLRSGGRDAGVLGPRAAIGLSSLLARTGAKVDAIAEEPVLALELDADALSDLFEDHFSILVHVVGNVARSLSDADWSRLDSGGDHPRSIDVSARELDLVDRVALLSRFTFLRASFAALIELAQNVRELRPKDDAKLWDAGERSAWLVLIVSGGVVTGTGDRELRAGPDSLVGARDALFRAPRSQTAVAKAGSILLRIDVEVVLDLCEDHPEVLVHMLASLARLSRFDGSTEAGGS